MGQARSSSTSSGSTWRAASAATRIGGRRRSPAREDCQIHDLYSAMRRVSAPPSVLRGFAAIMTGPCGGAPLGIPRLSLSGSSSLGERQRFGRSLLPSSPPSDPVAGGAARALALGFRWTRPTTRGSCGDTHTTVRAAADPLPGQCQPAQGSARTSRRRGEPLALRCDLDRAGNRLCSAASGHQKQVPSCGSQPCSHRICDSLPDYAAPRSRDMPVLRLLERRTLGPEHLRRGHGASSSSSA